jgi:hypothetical protein
MARLLFAVMGMGLVFAACLPAASIAQQRTYGTDSNPVAAYAERPATLIRGPSRIGALDDLTGAHSGSVGRGEALRQRPEVAAARESSPTNGRRMETLLQPQEPLRPAGGATPGSGKYQNLEIQVSHSEHVYKLFGVLPVGSKAVLYECRVGLGSPTEFPTPVGVYYVTHIYDDNPWWIPPPNRAWAAGQSPSQRVYGGTMAPLLKKRTVNSKKKTPDFDDYISEEVRLEDHGYRFHGTNAPRSIGHNQSHGCVRMLPPDAKEAANLIKEHVGVTEERKDENGKFVILRAPVRLNLIK